MHTENYSIAHSLDKQSWSDFVFQHPYGNIFHTPEMYDVFLNSQNHTPKLFAAMNKSGRIASIFIPVLLNHHHGFHNFLTNRCVSYGSLLANQDDAGIKSTEILLNQYIKHINFYPIYTELRNIIDLTYLRNLLIKYKFCYYDYLNYVIPLEKPFENMLNRMCRSARKSIRKELRNKTIEIESVHSFEKVSICYDILRSSYHYNCVPLADKSLFLNSFRILYPKNMIKFTLAKYNDDYIATSIDLLYKDTIYGWYGGFIRQYSKLPVNIIIMWHVLTWGASQGFKWYDFGGAGKPDEKYGVRDFKAKFGGNLVNYGRFLYIHSPIRYHIGTIMYKILRSAILYFKSNLRSFFSVLI